MKLGSERKKRKTAIINVTSLIDVVLLLLIFFMLTTRFVQQPGMKLDLPEAKSQEKSDKVENIVTINSEGSIFLNDELINELDIDSKLAELIDSTSTENALVLKADKITQHGLVVKIMDKAQIAGFQKLVIATELSE